MFRGIFASKPVSGGAAAGHVTASSPNISSVPVASAVPVSPRLITDRGNHRTFVALLTAEMVGVSVDIVDIEQSPQTVPGPLGLPPVLITFDDLIIFEPIAIARYLAVASSQLLGGRLSSLVDSWTIFCVQKIENDAFALYAPYVGRAEFNSSDYSAAKSRLLSTISVIDAHLGGTQEYLVGTQVTLADITLFSYMFYPMKFLLGPSFQSHFISFTRWFRHCGEIAAFVEVCGPAQLAARDFPLEQHEPGVLEDEDFTTSAPSAPSEESLIPAADIAAEVSFSFAPVTAAVIFVEGTHSPEARTEDAVLNNDSDSEIGTQDDEEEKEDARLVIAMLLQDIVEELSAFEGACGTVLVSEADDFMTQTPTAVAEAVAEDAPEEASMSSAPPWQTFNSVKDSTVNDRLTVDIAATEPSPVKPSKPARLSKQMSAFEQSAHSTTTPLLPVLTNSFKVMTEREALTAFFISAVGNKWINRTNWESSLAAGAWWGVRSDSAEAVVSVCLPQNNLRGCLTLNFANLRRLQVLDLSGNQISGIVPDTVALFRELEVLNLSGNKFTGPIPDLDTIKELKVLRLNDNQFSGSLPGTIGSLTKLEVLDCSNNKLSAGIPWRVGDLVNLRELRLGGNELSGMPTTALSTLVNLTVLDVGRNRLAGSLLDCLGNLRALSVLDMSENHFSGAIPESIYRMESLRTLDMHSNSLAGVLSSNVAQLTHLIALNLSQNKLNGPLPESLCNLSCLQSLHLNINSFTGRLPEEIGAMLSLQRVVLSGNQFSGHIPLSITRLVELRALFLSGNAFVGGIPPQIGDLSNLEQLYLNSNRLTGPLPESISGMVKLKHLYIDGNSLSGGSFGGVFGISKVKVKAALPNCFISA